MEEDPIRKYSEATREFNEAYSKLRDFGMLIADVARYLNNKPYDIGISSTGVGLPPEITMVETEYHLDAKHWPTAEQIAKAVANLWEKRKNLEHIWSSLSPTDRELVNPPDTKK